MAKKILVVEDGDDSRSILTIVLRSFGYESIEAANGGEAVKKALSEKPDLILLDLGLPDISGIDVAKAMKENPTTAHIPIIAYTAWTTSEWMESAARAGIADYLVKPFPMKLMKDRLEKIFTP
jgi:DNA-binding response OmpR family regulator